MTYYSTARQNGLLPPLALAVAAWKSAPQAAASVRTINPLGAGLIFAAAWLAGFAGSLAALLIAAAFLAGLYAVKAAMVIPAPTITSVPTAIEPAAVQAVMPAQQLAALFPGLTLRKVELQQPAQPRNGKPAAK